MYFKPLWLIHEEQDRQFIFKIFMIRSRPSVRSTHADTLTRSIYKTYTTRCSINRIIYRLRGKQVCKSCNTTGSEATFCLLEQKSIHFKNI